MFHAFYVVTHQNTDFPLTKRIEKRQTAGYPSLICAEPCLCLRKQKCVTTELRCHYLATIDHGATFFLCLLHCSQKHAHCLFGVEWPIENASCREKGMLLISPWMALFYYSKSSPNEQPHLFVQLPSIEQESATFPSKSTGNKEGSAGCGLHRNHSSLRGERK